LRFGYPPLSALDGIKSLGQKKKIGKNFRIPILWDKPKIQHHICEIDLETIIKDKVRERER